MISKLFKCSLNEFGYYKCYDVENNSACKIKMTNDGLTYNHDLCYCYTNDEHTYYCYNNN